MRKLYFGATGVGVLIAAAAVLNTLFGWAVFIRDPPPVKYASTFAAFNNAKINFRGSYEDSGHMRLHETVITTCAQAFYPSAMPPIINHYTGKVLKGLPERKLNADDINSALGGPIGVDEMPQETACITALNIYYHRYPGAWNLVFAMQKDGEPVRKWVEEKFVFQEFEAGASDL